MQPIWHLFFPTIQDGRQYEDKPKLSGVPFLLQVSLYQLSLGSYADVVF